MKPAMSGRWNTAQLLRSVEETAHVARLSELASGSAESFFDTGLPSSALQDMEFPSPDNPFFRTSRGFHGLAGGSSGRTGRVPSQIMRSRRALVAEASGSASAAAAAGEAQEACPEEHEVFHDCMDLEENVSFNFLDDCELQSSEVLTPPAAGAERGTAGFLELEPGAQCGDDGGVFNPSSRGASCKRKSCTMRSSSPVLDNGSNQSGAYSREAAAHRQQLLMGCSSSPGASSSRSAGLVEGPRPQKTRLSTDVLDSSLGGGFLRLADNGLGSSRGEEYRPPTPPTPAAAPATGVAVSAQHMYSRSARRAFPEPLGSRRAVPLDFQQLSPDLNLPAPGYAAHLGIPGTSYHRVAAAVAPPPETTSLAALRHMRSQTQRSLAASTLPQDVSSRIARASAISSRGLAAGSSSSSVPLEQNESRVRSMRMACLDLNVGASIRRGVASYFPGLRHANAADIRHQHQQHQQQQQQQQQQHPAYIARGDLFSRTPGAGVYSLLEAPETRLHPPAAARTYRPPVLPGRRELAAVAEGFGLPGAGFDWERPHPRLMAGGIAEILRALERVERDEDLTREQLLMLEATTYLFGGIGIHDDHQDWRLDIDNMSYEELLALGDRIGTVSTGVNEETIGIRMKRGIYTCPAATPRSLEDYDTKCCVCQEEYERGAKLGIIDCGHSYHADCIRQWLVRKNSCPICKATAIASDGDARMAA